MPLAMILEHGGGLDSPFVIPVAGCLMVLGIVLGSIWSGIRTREIESTERLAAIAKGIAPPPTPAELAIIHGRPNVNDARRRARVRLSGIVLLGAAAGLILFFIALTAVLHVRQILCGAAVGLIPLAIGIGFLVDARIQSRELDEAHLNTPPAQLVR